MVATHKPVRIGLVMDEETEAKLDALRRAEDNLPSRGEMIRRLIDRAATKLPKKNRG